MIGIAAALLLSLASATAAAAQEPAPPPADPVAPITTDLFDVIRAWRNKPPPPEPHPDDYQDWMTAVAPVINYSPTSGAGFGVAGNAAFYTGPPRTTKISSIVASAIFTTKKQLLVSAKVDTLGLENGWRMTADGRFYNTSQDTFGLGTGTSEDDAAQPEVQLLQGLRNALPAARPADLPGGRAALQPPLRHPPGRRRPRGGLARVGVRRLLAEARVRPGDPVIGGRGRQRDVRHPRRHHQPQPRLVRAALVPDVLRGLPRRLVELAAGELRRAELPPPDQGRPAQAGVLDLRRPGHRRLGPVPRPALDRRGHLQPLGPGLSPGTVPRRADGLRRSGIPLDLHEERAPRHGGVPEHADAQRRDRGSASCSTISNPAAAPGCAWP